MPNNINQHPMSFIRLFMDVNSISPAMPPDSTWVPLGLNLLPQKRVQYVLQTGTPVNFQLSFFQLLRG
jgi:hypothetical protein